jgi:putative glutamine amidotransferase
MKKILQRDNECIRPIVGIVCDRLPVEGHDSHAVKHSYIRALSMTAQVLPVLIPAMLNEDVQSYIDMFDGLLFPGGASNVDPLRYGEFCALPLLVDHARDHVALDLLPTAVARGIPILAICRGFQEMNVAFGGSLYPDIYAVGRQEYHRENPQEDLVTRYRHKHDVELNDAGILKRLIGKSRVGVNSLHNQGISRLAEGLTIEAIAPDGLIEAASFRGHPFAVGVQWHPEAMLGNDEISPLLFQAFGEACCDYQMARQRKQRVDHQADQ